MTSDVKKIEARQRYEMAVEGHVAFADYRQQGSTLQIMRVETPVELRGGGVAGRLMAGIVELARAEQLKLVPICSYAVAWFRRHPEHEDVLAD